MKGVRQRKKAMSVLQGMYGYTPDCSRLINSSRELHQISDSFVGGGIVHISSSPRGGLTSFLDRLQAEYGEKAIKIDFSFSGGQFSLLEHFAIALRLRSPHERINSVPTYMHEYVKCIGLKVVLIDDLECFMITSDESLCRELIAISQCGDGLVILFTTQNVNLSQRAKKLAGDNAKEYWLNGRIEMAEAYEIAEKFCAAANRATRQSISFDRFALKDRLTSPLVLNDFIKLLEGAYLTATLNSLSKLPLERQCESNEEILALFDC